MSEDPASRTTPGLPAEPRVDPDRPLNPEVEAFRLESNPAKRAAMVLGPGLITGASDDDPSGIATYAQTGASYGYTFLWTTIVMLPMMISIQYICARIGLVTGRGLANVFRQRYPRWILYPVVLAMVVANTANAGADIGAIAAALNMLIPVPAIVFVIPIGVVIMLLADHARPGSLFWQLEPHGADSVWVMTPIGMVVSNLELAVGIPLAITAVWIGFGWRPRWTFSLRPGMRWGWLGLSTVVAVGVLVPMLLLPGLWDSDMRWSPASDAGKLILAVLLTTPLQAAGEEFIFRGWLNQLVGSLLPWRRVSSPVAAVVSSTLFTLAHGQQDIWLFSDRFLFGMAACWLVWRTGGLETGIAVHAVNNIVIFVVAALTDQLDSTMSDGGDLVGLAVDVAMLVVVCLVVHFLARRRALTAEFVPPAAPAVVAAAPVPVAPASGVASWSPAQTWAPAQTYLPPAASQVPSFAPATVPGSAVPSASAAMPGPLPGAASWPREPGPAASGPREPGPAASGPPAPAAGVPGSGTPEVEPGSGTFRAWE